MAKRASTEQLAEEFKSLRVDGASPAAVLTARVKRISEIPDSELRDWVTVEEDEDNKRVKMTIQMNIVNPPAWLSDPASVEMRMLNAAVSGIMGNPTQKEELETGLAPVLEGLKTAYLSMPEGNEGACAPVLEELEPASAPPLLDGACAVFEEAAKRQRRFARVIQDAVEGSDPRVAVQEILAFAATEVETVAYGAPVQPEEGAFPVVTVTAAPDAFELEADHVGTEDDINGFYGMGTSDHDAPLVDLGEDPSWRSMPYFRNRRPAPVEASPARIDLMADPCYRSLLTTILKDATKMGDQPTIVKLKAMGVDLDYEPSVLPPSPCFLVEEQNAVVA